MAWPDDIQEVKYTSPSGKEFTFLYENTEISVDKKTAEFIFPEVNGAFIQDLGIAGRKFPFTLFFSGEDYNTMADDFLLALEEKGIGQLNHPLYGNRIVVPTGTITRRDDLISGANQSAFSVTFSETLKDISFPASTEDVNTNISNLADNFQGLAASQFAEDIILESTGDNINLQTAMQQQLTKVNESLKKITAYSESINATYQQIKTSYENNIENVFDNAEEVARQEIILIRLPSKTKTDIKTKIKNYGDILTHLFDDFERAGVSLVNTYFETNKNAMSCIVALNESVLINDFTTRNEAVETSEMILDLYDDLLLFQDEKIDQLEIIDTGEGYDVLAQLVSKVAGYLISLSFSLPSAKKIILGEERNCIELCAELYQDLEKLDYFIETNDLTADEIEILPIGKEIVYYE